MVLVQGQSFLRVLKTSKLEIDGSRQEGWGGEGRVQKEGMSEPRTREAEWDQVSSDMGRERLTQLPEAGPGWVSLSSGPESRSREQVTVLGALGPRTRGAWPLQTE